MRLTLRPRASRRQPMEAAARPLPSEDTTPPVTKMYFADIPATSSVVKFGCAWCARPSISQTFSAGCGAAYSGAMAAYAQPVPQEATVREAVASIPLPEGVKLLRLEF